MDSKKLIILIIFITTSMTLTIAGFFAIYKYQPTWLGLSENIGGASKPKYDPTVKIKQSELKALQSAMLEKSKLKSQQDSLKKYRRVLYDSLKSVKNVLDHFDDSLNTVKDSLNLAKKQRAKLFDSLSKIESSYNDAMAKIRRKEDDIKTQDSIFNSRTDSVKVINYKKFAKIYDNAKAPEVAKILENVTASDAALILKLMNKKKAGKVLDAMKPERAASILKESSKQ